VDPKLAALKATGTLNRNPHAVVDPLFRGRGFFDPRDLLQVRYEMVRRRHVEDVPMAVTAQLFGVSLPTAYQAQAAFAAEGLAGLLPKRRGPKQGHKLTPEILAYLTYGKGFRTGGFNPATPLAIRLYQNEVSTNYEGGIKSTLLDNRLVLNAAAFHTEFDNQQFFFSQATTAGIYRAIINIPKTHVDGGELEAQAAIEERRLGAELDGGELLLFRGRVLNFRGRGENREASGFEAATVGNVEELILDRRPIDDDATRDVVLVERAVKQGGVVGRIQRHAPAAHPAAGAPLRDADRVENRGEAGAGRLEGTVDDAARVVALLGRVAHPADEVLIHGRARMTLICSKMFGPAAGHTEDVAGFKD